MLGRSGRAETPKGAPMDIDALRQACNGVVAARGDANFTELIHGNLWNRLIPDRAPQVVVRVKDEQDVIAAIRFARENGLKVVVRGGGHNWCQPTLRNGGMLIDVSELNKIISIDVGARKAVVQPVVSNRDVQKAQRERPRLPHRPLPAGQAQRLFARRRHVMEPGQLGIGHRKRRGDRAGTAEGELITASKDQHPDYFWAARGSGSGFFGVVTRYHLKLYPLPRAIHGSTYFYSMDDAAAVATWLGEKAAEISPAVELSLFLMEAPADLKDKTAANGGKVAMVTRPHSPIPRKRRPCWSRWRTARFGQMPVAFVRRAARFRATVRPVGFDLAGGAAQSRGGHLFKQLAGRPVKAVAGHMTKCPSPITVILFTIFTGPNVSAVIRTWLIRWARGSMADRGRCGRMPR